MEHLLEITDLTVEYHTIEGTVKALNGVHLSIDKGEALGLVGETGAGKTTTAVAALGLLPKRSAKVVKGSIRFEGKELLDKKNAAYLQSIRGDRVSMVFQNPLTSLNPVFTVGEQVAMVFRQHQNMSKRQAMAAAGRMLETVGIPAYRVADYPHQFSGGMRQRVGIVAALACKPDLLIADEPTTALDVTIQAQVLELMKGLQRKDRTSLLMITHNLGIVRELCEKVAVMYAGRIIEQGGVDSVFANPMHPYTRGLIGSLPDINKKTERLTPIPGFMSNPMALPTGCKFAPRCPICVEQCTGADPQETQVGEDHRVACCAAEMMSGVS